MIWILVTALLICVIITVHELGHFLVARACGVKAERFSIGIGPRILSIQSFRLDDGSTTWRLNSALIGKRFVLINFKQRPRIGIVKMTPIDPEDEDDVRDFEQRIGTEWVLAPILCVGYVSFKPARDEQNPEPDTIPGRPLWQKITICLAGPFMNLSFAVIGLTIFFCTGTDYWYHDLPPVGTVVNERVLVTKTSSELYEGGLEIYPGDQVLSVNGVSVSTSGEVYDLLGSGENTLELISEGDNNARLVVLDPSNCLNEAYKTPLSRCGILGVKTNGTYSLPVGYSLISASTLTLYTPVIAFQSVTDMIKKAWMKRKEIKKPDGYVGVALIADQVSSSAEQGWIHLLNMAVSLSLVVGWLNLLPIPPLDGGQIVRHSTEKIAGPRLKLALNHSWIIIGLLLMFLEISFLILSSIHDVLHWILN